VSRQFGEVRQLGYVVRDIEAAMKHWTEVLGVGPFFFFPRVVAVDAVYRGQPQPFEVAIALSQSGPMQIELMCQLSDGPSALRDFADVHGEGLHHLAYWTDSFEGTLRRALDRGLEVWQSGAIGSRENRFAYLTTQAHGGTVVELSEVSGMKGKLFAHIAQTAANWDGRDAIRRLA
jgi:hypothetical protein